MAGPRKAEVLFFSANPDPARRLSLDKEAREIEEQIRKSRFRDSLSFETKWATRPDDLLQSLNDHTPTIVHFSGHGNDNDEILLVGEDGQAKPVKKEALRHLFKTFRGKIRLVFLNACYSLPQAEAIVEEIECAVGMGHAISDDAAIVFAASFYRAIGFGKSVEEAFSQGKTALLLIDIPETSTPQLCCKNGVDPAKVFVVSAAHWHMPPPVVTCAAIGLLTCAVHVLIPYDVAQVCLVVGLLMLAFAALVRKEPVASLFAKWEPFCRAIRITLCVIFTTCAIGLWLLWADRKDDALRVGICQFHNLQYAAAKDVFETELGRRWNLFDSQVENIEDAIRVCSLNLEINEVRKAGGFPVDQETELSKIDFPYSNDRCPEVNDEEK